MLETIGGIVVGGALLLTYKRDKGMKDATKIQKIAKYAGLTKKDGKDTFTIQLLAKRKKSWGVEYVYRIPLGFSFDDFQDKRKAFEDGINLKSRLLFEGIEWKDFLKLKIDKTILEQIRAILNKPRTRKEVILDFDGCLIFRVYNEPMPKKIPVTPEDLDKCKGWKVWVGDTREERIYLDFEERPHMIVAGATGFGKSEVIKLIITTLLRNKPEEVKFYLIDLKGGTELGRYRNLKQVLNFGRNPDMAKTILQKVKKDMEDRLDWLYDNEFKDVKHAGIKERHFVVIDEAADIAKDTECMKLVTDISRRGRSAGYRLIYATQYPTNETLPSQVRANVGSRIVFRLETEAQSRAVLDESGAEKLPEIEGRAIFRRVSNKIVQTPLIENDLIDNEIKINIRGRVEFVESTEGKQNTGHSIEFKDS